MTLRPGEAPSHGIAVFPFLKTTEPVRLGSFNFRSTTDTADISEEDATHVREIAEMLFLQDDLRIQSAAYAMLPALDLDKAEPCLQELKLLQAIVAYCYSAPRLTFGDVFLHFEHASLAIFSPEPVSIFLVRPEHHVETIAANSTLTPDQWGRVPGYRGRYNFRHPFWVTKGSRLYPPVPHIGLNISQNIAHDLPSFFESPQLQLLRYLVELPTTETKQRILRALSWYNRANVLAGDDDSAIINLAVAFETLLGLPRSAKTDRFIGAVSLLLGRMARLDLWAEQFYGARSDVTHEGQTERLYFAPTNSAGGPFYQSLLAYGRQIFQLCLGTLLFGAHLGSRGLRDQLATNQERFRSICKTLDDESLTVGDRFAAIDETVALASEFRYVRDTGLRIETLVGAVQRAARSLLTRSNSLEPLFKERVEALARAQRSGDSYDALAALQDLHDLKPVEPTDPRSPESIMRRLAELVWHYTFLYYFSLKEKRDKDQEPA